MKKNSSRDFREYARKNNREAMEAMDVQNYVFRIQAHEKTIEILHAKLAKAERLILDLFWEEKIGIIK